MNAHAAVEAIEAENDRWGSVFLRPDYVNDHPRNESTRHVRVGRTILHAPIDGFAPVATCCASVPGGASCAWHTDDADHARALAVEHAAGSGHRVVVDDAGSTVVLEASS